MWSLQEGSIWESSIAKESTFIPSSPIVGSSHIGSSQVNPSHIGSTEVSFHQLGTDQLGSSKIAISQIGTSEVGSSQISENKTTSNQLSATETTGTHVVGTEISTAEIALRKVDSSNGLSDGIVLFPTSSSTQVGIGEFNSKEVSFPSSIASEKFVSSHLNHNSSPNLLTNIYSTAQTLWQTTTPINLNFEITNLPTGQLAEATITGYNSDGTPRTATITIDNDANGVGWFIDATPWDSSEFNTTLTNTAYKATTGEAAGKYDLLTAIMHEMGHSLGFINGYSEFDNHVHNHQFVGDGFTATLTRDGSHLDSNLNPYSLMNSSLKPGKRKLPSALELEILNAIRSTNLNTIAQTNNLQAPLTSTALTGILNGTFDTQDDWFTRGNSTVSNGHAIIAEDPRYNSNFKQTFTIPQGAKYLQFTLLDTNLGNNLLSPGDAFEVALLDSHTQASLVRTATGLTFSDALLNVQSDGRMYLSDDIIPTGYGSLHSPMTFTVDISHITPGTEATLYFDLLGFGDRDASVIFDNIRLLSDLQTNITPIAQDDAFSTNQNTSMRLRSCQCWVSQAQPNLRLMNRIELQLARSFNF
jgi:hypothetical protein